MGKVNKNGWGERVDMSVVEPWLDGWSLLEAPAHRPNGVLAIAPGPSSRTLDNAELAPIVQEGASTAVALLV